MARKQSDADNDGNSAADDWIIKFGSVSKGKRYGTKFSSGFLDFRHNDELTDVTVIGPDGSQYRLHMLLLAYHSEFFRKAFTSEFRESSEHKLTLGFSDPNGVWPALVEYLYTEEVHLTDENVMPLFAMARELMIPKIQEYCSDYAQGSLECSNALTYLSQAVQLSCDGFRQTCVQLVAEGFSSSFFKATDGLPVEVINEILNHPSLNVQCEEQILLFVQQYIRSHSLSADAISQLFSHVRFMYLSNDVLARLADDSLIPKDLLLSGMAARLSVLDRPDKLSSLQAPRPTYCSAIEYGLPGGSEYVSVPIESIWEDLVPLLRVHVSGEPEGDPESVLRTFDDSTWFAVSGDGRQPVWIELQFPDYMRVVEINKYSFSHGMNFANHMFPYGISDSQWFSMKGLVTQVCQVGGSDSFVTLKGYESCQLQTEFTVSMEASHSKLVTWRRMRILPADHNGDSTSRLSIRKLRLYGKVEVSLLQDAQGRDVLSTWRQKRLRSSKASL